MKRLLLLPFAGMLLLLLGFALLLASNLYTYYRLTDEVPIAELRFTSTGQQSFDASIVYGDFCKEQHYPLLGDEFRLDARFLKWRPWANLLGFDARYQIERLGGRYADITRENQAPHLSHALSPQPQIDLPVLLARYSGRLSPVDTLYGSSVYERMDSGFLYRVYRGQSGLLVRRQPLAETDGITIDIRQDCAVSRSFWRRLGAAVADTLDVLFASHSADPAAGAAGS